MQYRAASYANDVWDAYWFERNLQGDIVAVYSTNGTQVAHYTYDAWGNCTASNATNTVVANNPFRYRGYYYDVDLGLYYLNTRYYDANTGRFISPDGVISDVGGDIQGYNLYSYCFNNPIMHTDYTGNWPSWKSIKKWFKETFGFGVLQSQTYESFSADTFLGGVETGMSSSKVTSGDISKPISFYVSNASEWWKVWEYKVGVQININKGGFAYSLGLAEQSTIVSDGSTSTEFISGLNKVGRTTSYDVDFAKRTAGLYYHEYVRPLPLVGVILMIYYTGGALIPVAAPAFGG